MIKCEDRDENRLREVVGNVLRSRAANGDMLKNYSALHAAVGIVVVRCAAFLAVHPRLLSASTLALQRPLASAECFNSLLATPQAFDSDPAMVSEWYDWRRRGCLAAEPNPGHLAIAEIERRVTEAGGKFMLLTQTMEVNRDETGCSPRVGWSLRGNSGDLLPKLVAAAFGAR